MYMGLMNFIKNMISIVLKTFLQIKKEKETKTF